jgi:hypothetical protein
MLPDFPDLKKKLNSMLQERMKRQCYGDGVLSRVMRFHVHEGDAFTTVRLDGSEERSQFKEKSVKRSFKAEELAKMTPTDLVKKVDSMALEMSEQTSKAMFEMIRESTNETGNIVDAQGQPFSFDLILQMYEKMEIDFDEKGEPSGITMVVHPELGKRLPDLMKQWKADPECTRRYDELMQKKREDWNDRESRRKLVD